MRDPEYISSWSDTLTFRIQYQESRRLSASSEASRLPSTPDVAFTPRTSDDCRVMRISSQSMKALQTLPPTSLILLLTPVLTPASADKTNAEAGAADPFEFFGREMSKLHRRLRHVPYVPKVGMTETHAAFIQQAAAVVVVMCEPVDSNSASLENQQSFADAVVAKREDLSDDDDGDEVPFVLVRFDSAEMDYADNDYANVLQAPMLTKRASTKATQLLFRGDLCRHDLIALDCKTDFDFLRDWRR